MSNEKPRPFEDNDPAQRVLARLKRGPASTVELQEELHLTHAPRKVWELRKWYGWDIRAKKGASGVAVYTLIGKAEVRPGESPRCAKCNEPLRDIRQTLVGGWVNGRCMQHGRTDVKLP